MARNKPTYNGTVTINLTGLSVFSCDNIEVNDHFVTVTDGDEAVNLPIDGVICGIDEDGGCWYATEGVKSEELGISQITSSPVGTFC